MHEEYEYCPNCDANLTLQRGYDNSLPYWVCLGCGEMLINPDVYAPSDIIWRCDKCGAVLNIQEEFNEDCDKYRCLECGYENELCDSALFESEDERLIYERDPLLGLNDNEVLKLSEYKDISNIDGRYDVVIIQDSCERLYVKKYLTVYDKSVLEYIRDNPVKNMPHIIALYESKNCLIVIEEYIEGKTIAKHLEDGVFSEDEVIRITRALCVILNELHNISHIIIHRDIKPANVIVRDDGSVYLLDVNVAKWYNPSAKDDTRYLGTEKFAAPEQVGFGFEASSPKSDIYALGIMMNVMLTSHFPKEERAKGRIWDVIARCISLEADKRYSALELIQALDELRENLNV